MNLADTFKQRPTDFTLRTYLVVLLMVSAIPALLFALIFTEREREFHLDVVQSNVSQLSNLAANSQIEMIERIRQFLITLVALPDVRSPPTGSCSESMAGLREAIPTYISFGFAELDGTITCSALPTGIGVNIADRGYFQRAVATNDFSIGEYQIGRSTGQPSLNFAYPFRNANGEPAAVAYLALGLDEIHAMLGSAELPDGAVITLFDRQGAILSRFPDAQHWIGQRGNVPFIREALGQHDSITLDSEGLDGLKRLYTITTIGSGSEPSLFLAVGIPVEAAYAEANRVLLNHFINLATIAFLSAILLTAGVARLLVHPLRQISDAVQRLRAGDLHTRAGLTSGPREVRLLSQSFDEMVGALAQHEAERSDAVKALQQARAELELRVQERTAELEATNKELESFSYSVSHDLRAPLRAMNGFSRILIEDYTETLSPEASRYLGLIQKNADQMGQLIDDLLAFSRLGRQPLRKQSCEPTTIVRSVLNELRDQLENRAIDIQVAELPPCEADPALLKQVYANLLGNAIKFTKRRTDAVVEAGFERKDDNTVYFVRDNGAGFDMRYADKLFGVFQRLHNVDEFEGTGVGLAIVQRIVRRHGGTIWSHAGLNQGATFYFTLVGGIYDAR